MKLLKLPELNTEFIAHQLKTLRLSSDKKITEIAEATGYTPAYISLIENGKRNLTYKILRRILLYGFNETISSFFAKIFDEESTLTENVDNIRVYRIPIKLHNEDKTIAIQILIPTDASRGIELVKITLFKGSVFDEEFTFAFNLQGIVLSGAIEVQYINQRFEVHEDESFNINIKTDSSQLNLACNLKISNPSSDLSEVILLFNPPVF